MAFAEDLSVFFDTDVFAVEAVISLNPGTKTIKVIFNDPTQAAQIFDSTVDGGATFLHCKQSDVEDVRTGMTVTVNSKVYTIERKTRDGTGTAALHLKT